MSTTNEQTTNNFPNIERLKTIMSERSRANKEVVEVKKIEFENNIKTASKVYYDHLLQNIYDALNYMENSNKSGNSMVYVNVPSEKVQWGDPEKDKFIPWHWLHYGFPKRSSKKWDVRDLKCWEDNEHEMVFRKLQKLCYDNGYYLYDISDPTKGNKTFMKISVERRMDFEEMALWHNFNKFIFDAE